MWTGPGFGPPRTARGASYPNTSRSGFGRPIASCRRQIAGLGVVTAAVVGLAGTPLAAMAAPPDRALEFVGPAFKTGGGTAPTASSADGDRLLFSSQAGFAGNEAQDGFWNDYLAVRHAGGWTVQSLALGFSNALGRTDNQVLDATADLRQFLIKLRTPDGDNLDPRAQGSPFHQAGDDLPFPAGDEQLHAAPLCWPSRSPA